MRRGIKLFKSLTLSLALVLGLAGTPAGATELQNDVSATSSDAMSETMTKPCGDVTFHAIEGTPVHIDGGVSLDDAVSVEVAARDYDQYRNQYVYENLDYYEYNSIAYEFFLIGKDTLSYLDWSPAHDTQESLWGLLPECPIDYSPSNPPSGDEPPAKKLSSAGIFILQSDRNGVLAGLTTNLGDNSNLEYSWYATNDNGNSWALLKDWTQADEWLMWTPPIYGDYIIVGKVREKGSSEVFSDATNISYHPHIKGKCQMPYAGGGYLIGVESYENPNQSYKYEMLVLDCTLLAAGKDAWIYTTGKCGVSTGNALWTVWQLQYGYYWTLFRVYDENDVLLDEACYGFVNAY